MLKSSTKYIILLSILSFAAIAQEETSYAYKLDSLNSGKWIPTGVRVGFDIAGPIYNQFEPSVSNFEGVADIDIGKFFAVVEMGKGSYLYNETLSNYSNSGFFYRAGIDINMTAKDPNLNILYFGMRYATSSFSENLKGEMPSSSWGSSLIDLEQQNSRANWIEMNLGMRVRIWKSIFTGYAIRFKLLKHNTYNEGKFDTYFVPGYGLASKTSNWGISYYIHYRFEWKRKPIKWKGE